MTKNNEQMPFKSWFETEMGMPVVNFTAKYGTVEYNRIHAAWTYQQKRIDVLLAQQYQPQKIDHSTPQVIIDAERKSLHGANS